MRKKSNKIGLSADEVRSKISEAHGLEQIFLLKDEYARVLSEFNSHMSEEEKELRYVTKPIGDYYYTIINLDFNEYIIIDKSPIVGKSLDAWEDDSEN